MARKRKPRRIPRGLPGAGQFASAEQIEALKLERYYERHPAEAIFIDQEWDTLDELALLLETDLVTLGFELKGPIQTSDKPGFTTARSYVSWDVVDILLAHEISKEEFYQISQIVEQHLKGHYPSENEAMILAYFGEAEFVSDIDNAIITKLVGWQSVTRMFAWRRVFKAVWYGIKNAIETTSPSRPKNTAVYGWAINIQSMGRV